MRGHKAPHLYVGKNVKMYERTHMKKSEEKNIRNLRVAIASVDAVLFTVMDDGIYVFLVPINRPPFYTNKYGLPGGVIGPNETAEESALKHLYQKAHIKGVHIEQLYTFSEPNRDKRSRSISIAYMALVSLDKLSLIAGKIEGGWFPIKKLPKLAFDHAEIIHVGKERLQGKLAYTNIVSNLLPKQFTLTELQKVYEIILERTLDKRNFRKKILSINLVKEVGKKKKTVHRPAGLYEFTKKNLITISEVKSAL
jgi:8-oxo-dGTP diphosphatase